MVDFVVKCHLRTLYRLLVLPLLPIVIEGAAGEDGHNGYSIVAGVKEGRQAEREARRQVGWGQLVVFSGDKMPHPRWNRWMPPPIDRLIAFELSRPPPQPPVYQVLRLMLDRNS